MRRGGMRNDLDLIREILTSVRDREDLWPRTVELPDHDPVVLARHVERLHEDGLLDGSRVDALGGQVTDVDVRDLTTAGHQFLAALEAQDVWTRLKTTLRPEELAALPMRKLAAIAGELVERGARRKLGLD